MKNKFIEWGFRTIPITLLLFFNWLLGFEMSVFIGISAIIYELYIRRYE